MSSIRSWEDLLDGNEVPPPAEAAASALDHNLSYQDLLDSEEIPQDFKDLVAEKERLEGQMNVLTGKAPEDPDEERNRLRYPVFAHTQESRLREARLKKQEERRDLLQKRRQEQQVLQRKLSSLREAEKERLRQERHKKQAAQKIVAQRQAKIQAQLKRASLEEEKQRRQQQQTLQEAGLRKSLALKKANLLEENRQQQQMEAAKTKVAARRKAHELERARIDERAAHLQQLKQTREYRRDIEKLTTLPSAQTKSKRRQERIALDREMEKRDARRDARRLELTH